MNRIDPEPRDPTLVRELDSALVAFDQGARQHRVELMEQVSRLVGYPLTYNALLMLERMNEDATTRMTELASSVGVSCVTITRQIQDLERRGLVYRAQDDQDGRASVVRLTKEGTRVAEIASESRLGGLAQAVAEWGDNDLKSLIGFLQRFPDQFQKLGTAPALVSKTGEECPPGN